ncbi:MAG: flagellar basal body-associated FliL family protein [Candidatus Melainabacteria bacterium]|nr:flagellar basal body-associated FliL family protein [Candidatus Melainabacteria bacterium]
MADEELKEAGSAGGNPPNMILIVLFIFVAAFGGTYLASWLLPKTITVNQVVHEAREPGEHDHLPIHPFGDFVVNLADVSGSRFLKISITAKLYSEDFEAYGELEGEEKHAYHLRIDEDLHGIMPAIKDVVITTLSRKTSEEVIGYENKLALKVELKEHLNEVMHGEFKIYDIYFTDFIVQ